MEGSVGYGLVWLRRSAAKRYSELCEQALTEGVSDFTFHLLLKHGVETGLFTVSQLGAMSGVSTASASRWVSGDNGSYPKRRRQVIQACQTRAIEKSLKEA